MGVYGPCTHCQYFHDIVHLWVMSHHIVRDRIQVGSPGTHMLGVQRTHNTYAHFRVTVSSLSYGYTEDLGSWHVNGTWARFLCTTVFSAELVCRCIWMTIIYTKCGDPPRWNGLRCERHCMWSIAFQKLILLSLIIDSPFVRSTKQ